MSEVFPNKNPILFGEAEDSIGIIDEEAIAGLTGSLVVEDVNIQLSSTFDSSSISSLLTTTTGDIVSVTVTPVNATNKVKIIGRLDAGSFDSGAIVEIREGSTVLVDQLLDGGISVLPQVLTVNLTDISVAAHTYTMRIRYISGLGYQFGDGGSVDTNPDAHAPDFVVAVTDFLDTHTSVIATPATAIKQINSPDSHTTRQTEVIP